MTLKKSIAYVFLALTTGIFSTYSILASAETTHKTKDSANKKSKKEYIEKVVYHINEMSSVKIAFNNITNQLKENPKAIIHVVTYGRGIDFLLDGEEDDNKYPYNIKVEELLDKGVQFKLCRNTLTARNIAENKVLPNVKIVPSGASEIIRLQLQEGFAYFKP